MNVPNVSFTYFSIIYAFTGTPNTTTLRFGIIDMSNNNLQQTSFPSSGNSTNILAPSILEYTFPTAITTLTPRCLRIAVYNGSITASNYVNVRAVTLGFA